MNFEVGLGEKRTEWLCTWLTNTLAAGITLVRSFQEGLGRLGFSSRMLLWMKPFLSPLCAWAAAVPGGSGLKIPCLVKVAMAFILDMLRLGKSRISCASPEGGKEELFRTDSKGAVDYVVLGGWQCMGGKRTEDAPWFSLRLSVKEVPWLFKEGKGSSWSSTSSELLASTVAMLIFPLGGLESSRAAAEVIIRGGTDNSANEALSL